MIYVFQADIKCIWQNLQSIMKRAFVTTKSIFFFLDSIKDPINKIRQQYTAMGHMIVHKGIT